MKGVKDSIYMVRAHRKKVNYRITEGQPHYIYLYEDNEVIEFKNKITTEFINVLVEDIYYNT